MKIDEINVTQLTDEEKRKYLFLRQLRILNSFKDRNAISKTDYDISYIGLISKMKITEKELCAWLEEDK